jgi:hypothetical protein
MASAPALCLSACEHSATHLKEWGRLGALSLNLPVQCASSNGLWPVAWLPCCKVSLYIRNLDATLEKIMNETDTPSTFGVFKPVGHTLIAFHTEDELALKALGFADSALVHFSGVEMAAQVEAELLAANPLANFGYELDLIRAHGALAKEGCSFLVVHAPTDELSAQVAELVRTMKPATAQHYGRLLIQDLTERPLGRMGET